MNTNPENRAKHIMAVATRPLDKRLISTLPGKKNSEGGMLRYISGNAMIELMNEAFGPFYSIEFSNPWRSVYNKVNSRNGEYQPIEVVEVKCTITVPIFDTATAEIVQVKREGFGSAAMKARFEEMVLKTAQTDAMKKAAYSFGFAAELFFNSPEEASYCQENVLGLWTQNAMQQHAKEWEVVRKFMAAKDLGKNYNRVAMYAYDDPDARLTPRNIGDVVNKIIEKQLKEKASKEVA